MKNLILTTAFLFIVSLSFGQLKVVAPNGDVGVGTSTPAEKLEVDGNIRLSGAATEYKIGVGQARTATGIARFDFYVDANTTGNNYQLRMSSNPGGVSVFNHQGVKNLVYRTNDSASDVVFQTGGSAAANVRMVVKGDGSSVDVTAGDLTLNGSSVASDARLKTNITPYANGLESLMGLSPVSYEYNGKANTYTGKTYIGLIAQDLQKVAPELVSDHDHAIVDESGATVREETYLKIHDNQLKYMMINAIQEQQEMIEELQAKIESLEVNGTIGTTTESTFSQQQLVLSNLETKQISQISPNPFTSVARIDYNLQKDFTNATLTVYDVSGELVNRVALDSQIGTVEIDAKQLSSGMYTYSIEVDGVVIDTKKIIKE